MIVLEGLGKQYPGHGQPALEGVSLEIPDGAIYGILGRSGAGKSTLIRCLNLLERPSRGRILFDGRDITALEGAALRRHRQGTGMIFQHFNLLHARSVEENVAVPLEIAGVARREREARVSELLELVGLGEHRRAFPSQLSGGRSNEWASPAPWPPIRATCSVTRRPVPWIWRPRSRCWRCLPTSTAASGSP